MLPSRDGAVFDHPGPGALVNVGSVSEFFVPIGSNLPGVGAQWKLPGTVARRNQSHTPGFFLDSTP